MNLGDKIYEYLKKSLSPMSSKLDNCFYDRRSNNKNYWYLYQTLNLFDNENLSYLLSLQIEKKLK